MTQTNSNIKDVARRAGVSIATVSHVLNNTKHVSEETRERVLKAVEGLQYHPNRQARSLRLGQERDILVLVEERCLSTVVVPSVLIRFTAELQKLHKHVVTSFYSSLDQAADILRHQNFSNAYVFCSQSVEQKRSLFGADILFLNMGLEDCDAQITGYDQLNLGFFFYDEVEKCLRDESFSQIVMSYQQGKNFKNFFSDHTYENVHIMKSEVSSGSYFLNDILHAGGGHVLFADYTLFLGAIKYLLQNENVLYSCNLNIEYIPWFHQVETYGLPLKLRMLPYDKMLGFILEHLSL